MKKNETFSGNSFQRIKSDSKSVESFDSSDPNKLINSNQLPISELDSRSLKNELEWMTTEEAAAYLRLPIGSLRNLTSNGFVPYYKLGGRNRYRLDDLRNLLLLQKRGGF